MIKATIFDVGGVLHKSAATPESVRRELELTDDVVTRIWAEQMPLLNSGKIDEKEFWHQLHSEYGIREVGLDENLLGRDFARHVAPNDAVLAVARKLKQRGVVVAVLSNTIEPHARVLREFGLYDHFDKVFLSHEIGMVKPTMEIYRYVLKELGMKPDETIFVDDLKENIQAAEALGMHGIVYTTPERLRASIKKLIPDFS